MDKVLDAVETMATTLLINQLDITIAKEAESQSLMAEVMFIWTYI